MTNTRSSEDGTTVGDTRIVTDFYYDEKEKVWQLVASTEKQNDYDDRLYIVDNSNNDGETIRITARNIISKRIKNFNKNREII